MTEAKLKKHKRLYKKEGTGMTIAIDDGYCCWKMNLKGHGRMSIQTIANIMQAILE